MDSRVTLHMAEKLMAEGIRLVRADKPARAEALFLRARDFYEKLAEECARPEIQLLARVRRIHSRIDRIVRALRGEAGLEYYDVLDEAGRATGAREVSTLAHLRGTRHASLVVLFFNRAGETLLQRRSAGIAVFPGRQTFAATGHVAAGKDSREAAQEEIVEEIAAEVGKNEEAELAAELKPRLANRDGARWLCFQPRDENLIRVGVENEFESSLYLAEFVYWDDAHRAKIEAEAARLASPHQGHGIARILTDVDEAANTFSMFTFDAKLHEAARETAERIEAATDTPIGMMTDNVEKRSLYVYRMGDEEAPVLEAIRRMKRSGAPIDASMTVNFEWKIFEAVVHDFLAEPGRYTDGFVPFLSDPAIVARIQEASRF